MVITYYGKAFVRLSFGDLVVAVNPIGKEAELKSARFGADITLSSLNHPAFDGTGELLAGGKEPFEITGAGEYELSGVFIRGYESKGPQEKINIIYTILLEGMKIVHLGALAENSLLPSVEEDIAGADILFVPVGDEATISPNVAAKLASSLIPKLIIPILYGEDEKSNFLSSFLKEIGGNGKKAEALLKLAIKKKDLEGKEAEVAVLKMS